METKQEISYELMKKYGSRWAILTAMSMDMTKKGVQLARDIHSILEVTRIEITSGCYSTCEIDCTLNKVEGELVSSGSAFGEVYVDPWIDLLAKAMQGELNYEKITSIPALKPIASACGFLKCGC
ncbi:MAG: DUF2096 family protein [bacterium]